MFKVEDVKEAMKTAEIHLATAPAREGGRLRLSWKPWAHSFQLVHTKDGATVAADRKSVV